MPLDRATAYRRFLVEHPIREAYLNGHCWQYLVSGSDSAPAVLLLAGALGRGETSWEYITALGDRFRVLAPAYPRTIQTMTELADGVAALLDACAMRTASVQGGSFGGLAAQALQARHPHRIERLILSDTDAPQPGRATALRTVAACVARLPEQWSRGLLHTGVHHYLAALPSVERTFWHAHFYEMLADFTRQDIAARARVWADFDAHFGDAPPSACPTLILYTGSDRYLSPQALQRRYPHAARHCVSSRAGHAASLADPDAYIAPLLLFLNGKGAAA